MSTNLPIAPQLKSIARAFTHDLPQAEVYLVGGAVRDALLERSTKDFDLVVRKVPVKELEHWLAEHGQVNLVGKVFGVFKWQPAGWTGEAIDIALPRTEHAEAHTGQYRDFDVQSDAMLPMAEDLKRRDFTINALALNLSTGELIDPTGGEKDLAHKLLRTVGNATERFSEDLSRTLRCLRFACQLSCTIAPETFQTLAKLATRVSTGQLKNGEWLVPREVVARELLKALVAQPAKALELFDQAGFLTELLPEVTAMKGVPQPIEFHSEGDVFEHTRLALERFGSPVWQTFFGHNSPSLNVIVATLLHDTGKPLTIRTPEKHGVNRIRTDGHDTVGAKLATGICQRLKLTSYVDPEAGGVDVEQVTWLIEHHLLLVHGHPHELRPATLYRYFLKDETKGTALQQVILVDSLASQPKGGAPSPGRLVDLRLRLEAVRQEFKGSKLVLLMSGDDIMRAFNLTPGPKIGELIERLEEAQLEGKVKTRNEAEAFLRRYANA